MGVSAKRSGATRASQEGRVVAAYGRQFTVETDQGETLTCVAAGKKTGIACGDWVEFVPAGPGQGAIRRILPRTSLLYRSDQYREKIVAANVTQVIIVVCAVPSFYEELLNRCLVAAEAQGIDVLIAANKSDLPETAPLLEALELYRGLGYDVLPLSAKREVAPIKPRLHGHVSVLVGQSGVGKSSIVNALLGQAAAREGEVSEALDSGRHTTTHARLYHLDADSALIDSPGMQEFGLKHIPPTELDTAFPEFRPYLGECRFRNCRHVSEPGCAVEAGVAEGKISSRRLASYRRLRQEIE